MFLANVNLSRPDLTVVAYLGGVNDYTTYPVVMQGYPIARNAQVGPSPFYRNPNTNPNPNPNLYPEPYH